MDKFLTAFMTFLLDGFRDDLSWNVSKGRQLKLEGHVSQCVERMIDECSVIQRSFCCSCLSLAGFLANKSVHQLIRSSLAYEPIWVDLRLVFW